CVRQIDEGPRQVCRTPVPSLTDRHVLDYVVGAESSKRRRTRLVGGATRVPRSEWVVCDRLAKRSLAEVHVEGAVPLRRFPERRHERLIGIDRHPGRAGWVATEPVARRI